MKIIIVIVLIMSLSRFLYAGSKKSSNKKTTESKCQTEKKSCENKSSQYKREISQLKSSKSSLTSNNNNLKNENKKLKNEKGGLQSQINKLKNENKNLLGKVNQKETDSLDSLFYCKCLDSDADGKRTNCNIKKHWLCNVTKKIDQENFKNLQYKALEQCISKNVENYISQFGYWLKLKINSTYNQNVDHWETCEKNNSFDDALRSKSHIDGMCLPMRKKLKEFLLSDHWNAFYGNKFCIKGISQDELK
jgi:hypothetical protein